MKLRDIVSGKNDIRRKYFNVGIDDETKEEFAESIGIEVDDIDWILKNASIYVNGDR